ncbi:MAG: DUF2256 domain-containing protein [Planctomycetaceae bacterium]|nr:DUF2256 domain-containing protein [Planctomycetaceae bacterium]
MPRVSVARKKESLPSKTFATCGRPFSWRKKWERCWDQVRHCSEACRKGRRERSKGSLRDSADSPDGC